MLVNMRNGVGAKLRLIQKRRKGFGATAAADQGLVRDGGRKIVLSGVSLSLSMCLDPFSNTMDISFYPIYNDKASRYRYRTSLVADFTSQNNLRGGISLNLISFPNVPPVLNGLTAAQGSLKVKHGDQRGFLFIGKTLLEMEDGSTILVWSLGIPAVYIGGKRAGSGLIGPTGGKQYRVNPVLDCKRPIRIITMLFVGPIVLYWLIISVMFFAGYVEHSYALSGDPEAQADVTALLDEGRRQQLMGNTATAENLFLMIEEVIRIKLGDKEAAEQARQDRANLEDPESDRFVLFREKKKMI